VKKRSLSRLIERKSGALTRHLAGALEGDERDTHQARVTARRLGEMLALAGRAGDRAAREVRKTRQAIGTIRELDVALNLLTDVADAHEWPALPVGRVRRFLETERSRRRALAIATIRSIDLDALGERLRAVSRAASDAKPISRMEIRRRAAERRKNLADAVTRVGALYSVDRLHEVRIAVKKLRYSLELDRDLTETKRAQELRGFKREQETLGRLHDLQVLQSYVRMTAARLVAGRGSLARAFDRMVTDLEADCRTLHADWLSNRT
jgi:CHAD domain-containing protein